MTRFRFALVYHFAVAVGGLVVLLGITSFAELAPHLGDLFLFLVLSVIVKRAGFHVAPKVTHSLVGVVDLAGLMLFGAAGAGWIAGLSGLVYIVGRYARRRREALALSGVEGLPTALALAAFSFGLKACMAVVGALVYFGLGGRLWPTTITLSDLVPLTALSLLWFALDHIGWGLSEAIEKGRAGAIAFSRSVIKASLLAELLPLPLSILLAYQFVTLDRAVFLLIAAGIVLVSVAVQRVADLSRENLRRQMELQTLNDFGREVSAARLDETQTLELVYRYASRLADTSNFAISLVDERTQAVDLEIWFRDGVRQPPRHYDRWGGLAGWVVEKRRPLLARDIRKEPLPVRGLLLTAQQTRSALFVPLMTPTEVIGVVSVQSHEPHAFTSDHERLFTALANQSAVEVEQARLYRAQQRRTRQLETIAEVSQRVAGIHDLDELMEFTTALIKVNFGYYHVDIYLVRGERLVHQAGTVPGRTQHGFSYLERTTLIGTVATTGEPLLVNDVSTEPRYEFDSDAPRTAAELVVPLKADGKLLGVLEVQSDTPFAFTGSDVFVMQTLADQVALAIQEAELFASVQQEAYTSNALLQVADAVGNLNDIHEILQTLVRVTPLLVGVQHCFVLLRNPSNGALVGSESYGLTAECARALRSQSFPLTGLFADEAWPTTTAPRELTLPIEFAEPMQMATALALPMMMRGALLGLFCVDTHCALDARRVSLLAGIANQAALAIETVQIEVERDLRARLDQELSIGRTIQSSLLPQHSPTIAGFDVAALWQPALQVSGDFYDFVPLLEDRWAIVVADVSDKGVPAAIFMTLARTIIRSISIGKATRRTPHQVLERANEIIMRDASTDLFVTAVFAVLDPARCALTYTSAGHSPTLLVRADDQTVEWLHGRGIALGVEPIIELEERAVALRSGDVLVFYTDGVSEAMNADYELFGVDRLRAAVERARHLSAQGVLDSVMTAVQAFGGRHEQVDDLTMVVVRCE